MFLGFSAPWNAFAHHGISMMLHKKHRRNSKGYSFGIYVIEKVLTAYRILTRWHCAVVCSQFNSTNNLHLAPACRLASSPSWQSSPPRWTSRLRRNTRKRSKRSRQPSLIRRRRTRRRTHGVWQVYGAGERKSKRLFTKASSPRPIGWLTLRPAPVRWCARCVLVVRISCARRPHVPPLRSFSAPRCVRRSRSPRAQSAG